MVKYRVKFTESERGWGQNSWYNEYNTKKEAEKAIAECNKRNQDDWDRTGIVPDYYIQASDKIELIESRKG